MSKILVSVGEVQELLNQVARINGLEDWSETFPLFGVSDRTVRRWRNKADESPSDPAKIPPLAWLCAQSIASGESQFPLIRDIADSIPSQYINNAMSYQCPPGDFLKSMIGKTGLLGVTRSELAKPLRLNATKLGQSIQNEEISFLTWAAILLMSGVPVERVFYVNDIKARLKKLLDDSRQYSLEVKREMREANIQDRLEKAAMMELNFLKSEIKKIIGG